MSPVDAHEKSSISARVRYADPERIRRAVRDYAEGLRATHPEIRALRWFGSWVSVSTTVGSDVDFCIIVDKSDKPRRDRICDYLPLTFPVGIDLFILTVEEFATLRVEHPSLAEAIEGGVHL